MEQGFYDSFLKHAAVPRRYKALLEESKAIFKPIKHEYTVPGYGSSILTRALEHAVERNMPRERKFLAGALDRMTAKHSKMRAKLQELLAKPKLSREEGRLAWRLKGYFGR